MKNTETTTKYKEGDVVIVGDRLRDYRNSESYNSRPLFDTLVFEQKKSDEEVEILKYREWFRENSIYGNEKRERNIDLTDLIPRFLQPKSCSRELSYYEYESNGRIVLDLTFDDKTKMTNMDIKEWIIYTLHERIQNGDTTESPFTKIEMGWDSKKERHLSIKLYSEPKSTILELFQKWKDGDHKYLGEYYKDNFNSKVIIEEVE